MSQNALCGFASLTYGRSVHKSKQHDQVLKVAGAESHSPLAPSSFPDKTIYMAKVQISESVGRLQRPKDRDNNNTASVSIVWIRSYFIYAQMEIQLRLATHTHTHLG